MKSLLLFPMFLFICTLQAQKGPVYSNSKDADAFKMNLTASIKNVLRFVHDTNKGGYSFTKELVSVNKEGEPTYAAPFPMPGSDAFIQKGRTDIKKGFTYWTWSTRLIEAPKDEKAEEISALAAQADSIIMLFRSYLAPDRAHAPSAIIISSVVNKQYYNSNYAELVISFAKPLYQTQQQAHDSLVNLYKPLLSDPASAQASARQFCYALIHEDFWERQAVSAIRELLPGIAHQNINAAFGVCMGLPYFVKYDSVKNVLSYQQQQQLKGMAQKSIDDWNAEWERKYGKGDKVVMQQKKAETEKITNACAGYVNETNIKPEMLIKGVTVSGMVANKLFTGRFTGIDCAKGIAYITQPGTVNKPYSAITVQIDVYNYKVSWKKNMAQYHSCSRCGGAGGDYVTETTSKTKELPFGYFEGIITTSTRVTSKTYLRYCSKCKGTGLALE